MRKGLWSEGRFTGPNIALSNQYSSKVLGFRIGDRSIWNLDPVERYIAPETLYEQLVESVGRRITWDSAVHLGELAEEGPVISTIPLPNALQATCIAAPFTFLRSAIKVQRFRLPRTDVYQTVYFPDPSTSLYRASITGDMLIMEFAEEHGSDKAVLIGEEDRIAAALVSKAFGIEMDEAEALGAVEQKYGKIAPIPDSDRKQLLFKLTHDHDIYSLGRFATWRNILLDDVVDDIAIIRRLMKSSPYDVRREIA